MIHQTTETTIPMQPNSLLRAGAFPHDAPNIRLLETHISWVILTGKYAYKIKKPVQLPFVDYSTLELRKHFCQLELELNRELAPDIYLDVVKITGPASRPSIGGTGQILDYAVRMIEFSQTDILAHRLKNGLVTKTEIDRLAELIAGFHSRIPRAGREGSFGTPERIRREAMDNFAVFPSETDERDGDTPGLGPVLSPNQRNQSGQLRDWTESEFVRCEKMLELRHASGMIRRCHGDMHAGNIVLFNGRTEIFDRIEFNPDFQWTDCMSELAFPFMDLFHYGRADLAHRLLGDYLELTGDYAGLGVFRFYRVYRAMVRAKVDWIRLQQQASQSPSKSGKLEFVTPFLDLAQALSQQPGRFLYITHGLSGSGKSTAAMNCVEKSGAIRIRSDIERNRIDNGPDTGGKYSHEMKGKVYGGMLEIARSVLNSGFPVVVDATFLDRFDRGKFRTLAGECVVPFGIISCGAPVDELERRIRARKGDASEATVAVLHDQIRSQDPLTPEELACCVQSQGFSGAAE